MMSFRGTRLRDFRLPQGIVWQLEALAEAKGRQALLRRGRDARWTRTAK
jgi:hypothetical protein